MELKIPSEPAEEIDGLKKWLNDICLTIGEGVEKDLKDEKEKRKVPAEIEIMQRAVSFLRTESVNIRNEIKSTSTKLASAIPQAMTDIHRVTLEATSIKEVLSDLIHTMDRLEAGKDPLQDIVPLQRARQKMEQVSNTMQEVHSWNARLDTIESVFETHDITQIGKEVAALHKSSEAFDGLSDFKERIEKLNALKDRVEVVANPHLLAAMDDQDDGKIAQMVALFASIDRRSRVRDYFLRSRLEKVVALTQKYQERSDPEAVSPNTKKEEDSEMIEWLPLLLKEIITLVRSDVKWAGNAFGATDPSIVTAYIAKVTTTVALKILSKLEKLLENFCVSNGPETLPRAFDICFEFTESLARLRPSTNMAERTKVNSSGTIEFEEKKEKLEADAEKQNVNTGMDQLRNINLIGLLMKPILKAQEWQDQLERDEAGTSLSISINRSNMDSIGKLINSWKNRVASWVASVVERAIVVNGGTRGPEIVNSIDETLQAYLMEIGSKLKAMDGKIVSQNSNQDDNAENTDWVFLSFAFSACENLQTLRPVIKSIAKSLQDKLVASLSKVLASCPSPSLQATSNEETKQLDGTSLQILIHQVIVTEDSKRLSVLNAFLSRLRRLPSAGILPKTWKQISALEQEGEDLVFIVMMKPIKENLLNLNKWSVWTEVKKSSAGIVLPEFSLQPSDYITRVGEHMLSLVHQLEPYLGNTGETEEKEGKEDSKMGAAYWLDRVAKDVLRILVEEVRKVEEFSSRGKKQMKTDISYLTNVMSALDVDEKEAVNNVSWDR